MTLNHENVTTNVPYNDTSRCFHHINHSNTSKFPFSCLGISVKFPLKWEEKEEKTPFYEKIKDKVHPPSSLKPRLDKANKRLQIQIKTLYRAASRFSKRDKSLFAKTVKAYSKHDLVRAKVYANELAEIRKTEQTIMSTKLALEQISLRLNTILEFGDIVTMLSPTVSVLQNVGKGLTNTLPEAGKELGQIGDLLNGIIADSNQGTVMSLDFEAPNDEAKKILSEAANAAEQNIKQQLPEIPTDIPKVKKKVLT
jgi:division protein CdvB (Snf7/Vps24/ESCRT-III family)